MTTLTATEARANLYKLLDEMKSALDEWGVHAAPKE